MKGLMYYQNFLVILFFALFLNMDNLITGVTYGLKKTIIPLKSMGLIVLGSTISMYLAMNLGNLISIVVKHTITNYLSIILLIGLGYHFIHRAWGDSKDIYLITANYFSKWTPATSNWELFYLGITLSFTDFAEALGLATAGFPIFLTVFLFKIVEILLFLIGTKLGLKGFAKLVNGRLGFIPGAVLVLIGIFQSLFKNS